MVWWVFQHVVSTAALAAAVAIVCRLARFGPVVRHALWVLVLVKFVMPPLVVWPWTAPDPFGVAVLGRGMADSAAAAVPFDRSLGSQAATETVELTPDGAPLADERRDPWVSGTGENTWFWLLRLWATGSLCMLGLEGLRMARLAARVRGAAPADPSIVNRVTALSARLGVRPPAVVSVGGAASPAVWCLGRPRLIWPGVLPAELPAACIDGVIVHELAHIKRRDHLVGWIELAGGVVWWWNPLFWLVRSARREQAELSCDAWVISSLPDGRRAYAESLLALSAAAAGRRRPLSMAAVVGIGGSSRRVLERRLIMIMKGRATLRLPVAGLLTVLVMAAATLPAWATGTTPQQPPPPPPRQVILPVRADAKSEPAARPAVPVAVKPLRVPAAEQGAPPPPPPPRKVYNIKVQPADVKIVPADVIVRIDATGLPAEGRELLQGFETDRDAIQREAEQKLEARRETLVKALQDLQDELTKAGKLDEAVAIRDYLRSGGPGRDLVFKYVSIGRTVK